MSWKKRFILSALFIGSVISFMHAQGPAYIVAFGPTLSNQRVMGFSREPFLRYHGYVSVESTSEVNPNSLYARLGYHVKGSAVNFRVLYDIDGNEQEGVSYAMEFHNLSLNLGVKQRRELGINKYFHYGFGIRGDYNLKAKYDLFFQGLEGSENKITYGVNVDAGVELPLSELISVVFELGISPDFADQIYIPPQKTGFHYPNNAGEVILPETKLRNIVIEARVGLRMWNKIIYTD